MTKAEILDTRHYPQFTPVNRLQAIEAKSDGEVRTIKMDASERVGPRIKRCLVSTTSNRHCGLRRDECRHHAWGINGTRTPPDSFACCLDCTRRIKLHPASHEYQEGLAGHARIFGTFCFYTV